jgi:ClpP class serine protease
MQKRRRISQTISFKDRLISFAEQAREKAKSLGGLEREELLKKARQADTAAHIDAWANSPGLQPPK